MPKLELYYRPMCPFCQKVLRFMEESDLALELKDISGDPELAQDLMSLGGKTQVPCLSIDGEALYESDDIIQWLKDNN